MQVFVFRRIRYVFGFACLLGLAPCGRTQTENSAPVAVDFSVPATPTQSAFLWNQIQSLPANLNVDPAKAFVETLRADPPRLRALARLMREGEETRRLAAIQAAERLGVRRILPVLLELCLQDRSPVLRAASAQAIRTLNFRTAPPVLETVLASGNTAQAIAAAEALGRIGDPASESALRRALQRTTATPVGTAVTSNPRSPYPSVSRDASGRRVVSFRGPPPRAATSPSTGLSVASRPDAGGLEAAIQTALETLGR